MSRTTILHVDDDSNDIQLFQHACRKAELDFHVESVEDGDDAIGYLRGDPPFSDRERHAIPRLVLLDLKLPRLSGFEVLSWLRKEERYSALPVVVLSSSNHDVDVKRAYSLGANSYLVKPVAFEALVEIVKSLHHYWLDLNVPVET